MHYTIQPPSLITMHILVYCKLHCALCIDPKCHCLHPMDPFKCCMPAQIQQYIYYKRPCRDNDIKFAQFLYLTHTPSSFCHFLSDPHHSLYLRALFQFKKGKKRARKGILFFQQKSPFLSYKTFQYPFLPCIGCPPILILHTFPTGSILSPLTLSSVLPVKTCQIVLFGLITPGRHLHLKVCQTS